MKKLIRICENYSVEYYIQSNPDKSKLMTFSNNRIIDNVCLKLNNKLIERVNSLKYLSFDLKNNKNIFGIKNNINDIVIRTNVIIRNKECKIKLFNSQCLSL